MSWTHERISDVVDRMLVLTDDDILDVLGNGRRDTLALDISPLLDGVSFHVGRLISSMQWRRSHVTDPTSGRAVPSPRKNPSKAASN